MIVHLAPCLLTEMHLTGFLILAWPSTSLGSLGEHRSMPAPHECRLCGAPLTRTFVDLGMSPLCESYVPAERLDEPEVFYPLHVRLCEACLLVQLPAYVPGEQIFSDYAYFSSYSDSWVAHAKRYAEAMIERLDLTLRQPRHRGGQQRRLPAAAFPGGGHPGARRRARGQRGRGGPGPRHPRPRSSSSAPPPAARSPAPTAGPTWWPRTTCSPTCRTSGTSRPGCARWSRTTAW